MKTNNYWSVIVSTVFVTEVLFSTALYSLPGPGDYKKTADEVKKATAPAKLPAAPAPDDVNKAINAAKATPTPTLPGPDDYKKTADDVKKATASSKAGALPAAPAPDDVNKAVNAAKGNPDPDLSSKSNASSTSTQTTNLPYTFHDRYTDGPQRRDPLPTTWGNRYQAGSNGPQSSSASGKKGTLFDINNKNGVDNGQSQQSTSDTEDWHKKNKKKKHHGDANSTYDGSPVLYNKPKPTSDTEDWHKENKNHHHDGDGREDNAKQQGRGWLYLNLPQDGTATHSQVPPTSDRADQKASGDQHNKKKHHHHHDDQDQGND